MHYITIRNIFCTTLVFVSRCYGMNLLIKPCVLILSVAAAYNPCDHVHVRKRIHAQLIIKSTPMCVRGDITPFSSEAGVLLRLFCRAQHNATLSWWVLSPRRFLCLRCTTWPTLQQFCKSLAWMNVVPACRCRIWSSAHPHQSYAHAHTLVSLTAATQRDGSPAASSHV